MGIFGRKDNTTATPAQATGPDLTALTGDYTIDPAHTTIEFVARHAMVTNVRGSFQDFSGSLHLDGQDPAKSTATLDVTMASIDTGNADRDGHLKSADFFKIDEFPTMTFRSTKAESLGGEDYRITATSRCSASPGRSPSTWSSTASPRTRSAMSGPVSRARPSCCAPSGA